MLILIFLIVTLIGLLIYRTRLRRIALSAPVLTAGAAETSPAALSDAQSAPTLSVIIPAYNESHNIRDCVISVLQSSTPSRSPIDLWVVDDQSTDDTLAIVRTLQQELQDPRFTVLTGEPRPQGEVWMGKNWACAQAVQHATGEYLLFLDADLRLKPEAIATALEAMQQESLALLTVCPEIVCGCLAEWLVQPIVVSLLIAGFDFAEVNDPNTETAFATGPFMLFRRTAYEQLGGHRAVADQVVEDVELARRVKQKGLKLKYAMGHNLASVRMYRNWAAVWEGWTKNWHLGSRRNLTTSLYSAFIVLLVYAGPWIGLMALLIKGVWVGLNAADGLAAGVALVTIGLQYTLRHTIAQVSGIPPRYWWLTGVGGVLVTAIVLASIIKTETGWGWTWRGRSLKLPNELV